MNGETATGNNAIQLFPIGVIRNGIEKPMLRADKNGLAMQERMQKAREMHRKIASMVSELVLENKYEPLLDGIEGFSHILVLYWPHLVDQAQRTLEKVRPMGRKDVEEKGIFATCSPVRPNSILVTAVRLLERNGTCLRVRGLEAVDGSPILDLKPYNPNYYRIDHPEIPEWMQRLHREIEAED